MLGWSKNTQRVSLLTGSAGCPAGAWRCGHCLAQCPSCPQRKHGASFGQSRARWPYVLQLPQTIAVHSLAQSPSCPQRAHLSHGRAFHRRGSLSSDRDGAVGALAVMASHSVMRTFRNTWDTSASFTTLEQTVARLEDRSADVRHLRCGSASRLEQWLQRHSESLVVHAVQKPGSSMPSRSLDRVSDAREKLDPRGFRRTGNGFRAVYD